MKDHYNSAVDPRDLTKRLNRILTSESVSTDGDYVSRPPRFSRARTASSDTSSTLSRLPTFRKSATMSTTTSGDTQVSHHEVMRSVPLARECKESVEIGQGEFSKPRAGRKRRQSNESAKSHKSVPEFQYYGRHANTWLFNDFSITDSVKKGWSRISGKGQE